MCFGLSIREKDDLIHLLCNLATEYNLWEEITYFLDDVDDEDKNYIYWVDVLKLFKV